MEKLSLAKAVDALASPLAAERFSALTGVGLLVVELAGASDDGLDRACLGRAIAQLSQLAAVSVAQGAPAPGTQAARLRDACDIAVELEVDVEPIARAAAQSPLAGLAAVQLLRHSEHSSVHEALIAESLVYSMLQAGPEFAAWLRQRGAARPERSQDAARVRTLRDGGRLDLVLDRPGKRNAFSAAMRDGLCEGLLLALCDDSIDRIVLRGNGPAFCAGGDLDEFGSLPDPATAHAIRSTRNAGRLLSRCADRVVAQVHGACVGAGIELPAFAARVVATPDAFFQLPEVAMGLVPGAGGTASIPRRIGRQRTAWWALTGERIDAETALDWGLVDEIRDAPPSSADVSPAH